MLTLSALKTVVFNCLNSIVMSAEEFAFYCGRRGNLNSYGSVGLAAMSQQTLGDTLDVAIKYRGVVAPAFAIEKNETNDYLIVTLTPKIEIADSDYKLVLYYLAGSCDEMLKTLFGTASFPEIKVVSVDLPIPPLPFLQDDKDLSSFSLHFHSDACRLKLPNIFSKFPLAFGNRTVAQRFEQECSNLVKEPPVQYSNIVVKRISEAEYDFPILDDIAAELDISPRSLHRALVDEGTSFRTLLTNIKMSRAADLLKVSQLSITNLSDKLGYSDSAGFSKAFKIYHGATPKQFRGK